MGEGFFKCFLLPSVETAFVHLYTLIGHLFFPMDVHSLFVTDINMRKMNESV